MTDALKKLQAQMDAMYGWAIPEAEIDEEAQGRTEVSEEEEVEEDEEEEEPNDSVQVVEFQYKRTKNSVNSKQEWKQFMSSKVSKLSTDPQAPNLATSKEDDEDDAHDREILDMMQASNLVKQYTASELTGRDRLRYMKAQIEELSGRQQKVKTSLPIHLGLKKKAHERVEKKIQNAKNIGVYTATLEKEFIKGEKTLKSTLHQKKEKLDAGIVGSVGRFSSKKGVMTVSKSVISQVENQNRAGSKKGNKRSSTLRGTGLGGKSNKKRR
jgi:hypothetical protein